LRVGRGGEALPDTGEQGASIVRISQKLDEISLQLFCRNMGSVQLGLVAEG